MCSVRSLVHVICISACSATAFAQEFRQVYPAFETNEMTDICGKGDTLFITTLNWGLLRSTDAGKTWQDILSGPPRYDLLRIVAGAEALYCVPTESGMASRTLDSDQGRLLLRIDGTTGAWSEIRVPRKFLECNSVDISGDAHTLFVLQSGRDSLVLHRGYDDGRGWEEIPLPAGLDKVPMGMFRPAIFFRDSVHGIFVRGDQTGSQLFLTPDAGRSWRQLPWSPQLVSMLTYKQRPAMCWFGDSSFAFIDDGQVLVTTTDLGATWKRGARVAASLNCLAVGVDGCAFAADVFGEVWRGESLGSSWVRIRDEISSPAVLARQYCPMLVGHDTLVLATSEGHIWRSTDRGTMWDDARTAQLFFDQRAHFVDSAFGWLAGSIGIQSLEPGVLRTKDGGLSWEHVGQFKDDFWPQHLFFSNRLMGFIVDAQRGVSDSIQSIYNTTDAGDTWSVSFELSFRSGEAVPALVGGVWYGGDASIYLPARNGGLHSCIDAGKTWKYAASVFDTSGKDNLLYLDARHHPTIWAISHRKVYRSTDSGEHWSTVLEIHPAQIGNGFQRLFVLDETRVAVAESGVRPFYLHSTTDNGTTWTRSTTIRSLGGAAPAALFRDGTGLCLDWYSSTDFLASTIVHHTKDMWSTQESDYWEYRSTDITRITTAFFLNEKYTWLFSRTGVFRTTNGGVNWTALPPSSRTLRRSAMYSLNPYWKMMC